MDPYNAGETGEVDDDGLVVDDDRWGDWGLDVDVLDEIVKDVDDDAW